MKLVRYARGGRVFVGSLQDDRVTPLSAPDGSGDRELLDLAMRRDADSIGPEVGVEDVRLLPPLARPSTIRDFLTFEEHYANFLQGNGATPRSPTSGTALRSSTSRPRTACSATTRRRPAR